ncbi:hypothetical protein Bca4012_080444 [Brassica carinata]
MAASLFFMPTDQNPNEFLRNTYLVNDSSEIPTEPPQNSHGRMPGSETGNQKPKKQVLRGMGVARLERLRIEGERKNMILAQGGRGASPNATRSPDPGVVLQGFPSYGTGGPNMSVGGYTRNGSGQIPVYSPWGVVGTSTHEPSSIPTPQVYNHCDVCFKRQRINEEVRANGGGFPQYTMVPHFLPPDQRSQGFLYDHRITRYSASPSASTNQGSMEELGSGSPRNGTGDVKEYQFFPGSDGNKSVSSVSTSVGDCSPDTSTIDLSLKL